KNIRGLAWVAVKWAATVRPRVIMLENVEEFITWGPLIAKKDTETGRMLKIIYPESEDEEIKVVVSEEGEIVPYNQRYLIPDPKRKGHTFKAFINALKRQGYKVDYRELKACDYGAPTIRKRFFLVARCDGRQIVWPKPTHGNPDSLEVKNGKLKPWRTAAEIIDWSIPCPSIFDRKKPLAENTMRRIARGIQKFVIDNPEPFIIKVNHHGSDFRGQRTNEPLQTITAKNGWGIVVPVIGRQFGQSVGHSVTDPLGTITAGGGGKSQLIAASLMQYHSETQKHEVRGQAMDSPILTLDASSRYGLVAAFLAKHYGGNYTGPGADLNGPLPTVTAVDHNALVTSHLVKMKGKNIGQPVTDPLQTITAGGLHFGEVRAFLLKYYGTSTGQGVNEPLHTITTKDRLGLVTIHGQDYQIVDIGMRMLEPRELFAAQGFITPRRHR
ncbi:MAG: cytosine-specific methylase, partial [Firmicutes bacterium]|nr:cytosine-specific methylase [Bacillota bacterium]